MGVSASVDVLAVGCKALDCAPAQGGVEGHPVEVPPACCSAATRRPESRAGAGAGAGAEAWGPAERCGAGGLPTRCPCRQPTAIEQRHSAIEERRRRHSAQYIMKRRPQADTRPRGDFGSWGSSTSSRIPSRRLSGARRESDGLDSELSPLAFHLLSSSQPASPASPASPWGRQASPWGRQASPWSRQSSGEVAGEVAGEAAEGGAPPERRVEDELHAGVTRGNLRTVTRALARGACVAAFGDRGTTPLMLAAASEAREAPEIVQALVEAEANVNAKDYQQWSPLNFACRSGNLRIAKFLFDKEAQPNASIDCKTVLHLAAKSGNFELLVMLLQRESVVKLVHNVDHSGQTALHIASGVGRLESVKALIHHQAKVSAKDAEGRQPIHFACKFGKTRVVKFLVAHHASIRARDHSDASALLYAARAGHDSLCCYLLREGADPDRADQDGDTPHQVAAATGLLEFLKRVERVHWEQAMAARFGAAKAQAEYLGKAPQDAAGLQQTAPRAGGRK